MIYDIRRDDTLSQIAERLFGCKDEMYFLANRNGIKNPEIIQVEQVLNLHKTSIQNLLTMTQTVVNVEPSDESLRRIQDLFRDGFCTDDMAYDIYKAAIK